MVIYKNVYKDFSCRRQLYIRLLHTLLPIWTWCLHYGVPHCVWSIAVPVCLRIRIKIRSWLVSGDWIRGLKIVSAQERFLFAHSWLWDRFRPGNRQEVQKSLPAVKIYVFRSGKECGIPCNMQVVSKHIIISFITEGEINSIPDFNCEWHVFLTVIYR